jgi:predicted RecB family nuclease
MIRAGDAKAWKFCRRRFWYERNPPAGLEIIPDPFEELLLREGLAHERRVLEAKFDAYQEAESEAQTCQLMTANAPVIYQAKLSDDTQDLSGQPDFLVLMPDGQYQAQDAKFARSLDNHPEIKAQMGVYRLLLGNQQPVVVHLGNGESTVVGDDADRPTAQFRADAEAILAAGVPPEVGFAQSRCSQCPFDPICRPQFEADRHLSLVYGIDARSVPGLREEGIHTIEDLAGMDPDDVPQVPYLKNSEKRHLAALQAKSFLEGVVIEEHRSELPDGFYVHFDIETNPLSMRAEDEVYLWGLLVPPYGEDEYRYAWSDGGAADDLAAWREFLQLVAGLYEEHPDLRLVHFSHYEWGKVRLYAERHPDVEPAAAAWLLGDDTPLWDIKTAVDGRLVLPVMGYGLKEICKDERLVNFQWRQAETGGQWSVVRYHDFLSEQDPTAKQAIKDEILGYNLDDVLASRALEEWLRNRP